ncbi:PREDICTED: alaserpin-like [Ceratosolen solmsi marchali]|uniref:Alaserpin-like n=1 Tax=Ceratosolen solmsi marchali TaxID=326594 RepID=A0AAJ6YGN3_9HYME|nr:PREDICTED: alaserpin-like [Ceratosolen solmsi marchali]
MAAYGAGGITAEEMRSALRLPKNDEEAYRGFQEFITSLDNVSNVTLKVANKIYSSSLLKLKDKFKNLSSTHFGSESESLDFSKSNAVDIINKWCSEQTNGKIQDIIKPEQLGVDMKLVLLNAVYFKGNWKKQFVRERTSLAPFYTNETTTVEVPMMNVVDKFHYKELSELDAECLILPYANEDVNMIIILPKKVDGLKYVENNLEKFSFNYETDLKHYKLKIDLSLPKFKIISDINMVPYLKEMGMVNMFTNEANFSSISDSPLKVDDVLQKAFIEINEEGSEAAAVTGLSMNYILPSYIEPIRKIKVDKPFLYKIVYKFTTIFAGRVVNPLKM